MILLIDNYDSFTYNLAQLLGSFGAQVLVKTHDEISVPDVARLAPTQIVISPGPKRPADAGISLAVIRRYYQEIPILGICLGHQAIGQVFGAEIKHAKRLMHGKTSLITHDGQGLFAGVPNPLTVARYHSLAIATCPVGLIVNAVADDGEIMAIQHPTFPLYGLQFHPESFMTAAGDILLKNFLARV